MRSSGGRETSEEGEAERFPSDDDVRFMEDGRIGSWLGSGMPEQGMARSARPARLGGATSRA